MYYRMIATMLLLFGLALAAFATPARAAAFSCDLCPATTTADLNLRSGPSLNDSVLTVMPAGAHLDWDPSQPRSNGYVAVSYHGIEGWSFAEYLWLFPLTGTTTAYLNFRWGDSLDAPVIDVIPPDTGLQVIDGPSNGFYDVQYEGRAGWVSGDYLDFDAGGDGDTFAVGTEVFVNTDALNLRDGPGLGYDVSNVLFTGRHLFVRDGPATADGWVWYNVDAGQAGAGWVAGAYLALA